MASMDKFKKIISPKLFGAFDVVGRRPGVVDIRYSRVPVARIDTPTSILGSRLSTLPLTKAHVSPLVEAFGMMGLE